MTLFSRKISFFSVETPNVIKFIEAGLETEGREWTGIDQWRMDKFMMFIRRFLRQIFTFLKKTKWTRSTELNDVFQSQVVSNSNIALGFRLHFTDIYLEELAKIGGDDLTSKIILKLIEPFSKELSEGFDERLGKHITERIFHHLMRQSDLGIAYDESLNADFIPDEDMENDDEDNDDDESDEEMENSAVVNDPRAGNVSIK